MRDVPKAQAPKKRERRGSLARNMVLVFLPLTLIPVLLAGTIGFYRLYTSLREQTMNRISSDVVNSSNTIDARISAGEAFLKSLSDDSRYWPLVKTAINIGPADSYFDPIRGNVIREFREITNLQTEPYFENFMIVLPNGTVLISSDPLWEGMNLKNSALKPFITESLTEGLIINNPVFAGGYRVYTSQPVVQDSIHVATLIGIGNQSLLLRDLSNTMVTSPSVRSYFVSNQGDLLVLNQEKTELVNIMPGEELSVFIDTDNLASGTIKQGSFSSLGNIQVFGTLTQNESINSLILAELPQATMIDELVSLAPFMAIILFVLMIVVAGLVLLYTRRLVEPITELSQNAELFSEGDWSRRSIVTREDEIGMLGDSFNTMADELETQYRTLQWKVEERSRQIRMASEVAQAATSAPHLKELLRRTVNLILERFGFYDASIFLIDETGVYAVLAETAENIKHSRKEGTFRLAVGSRSLIGWAAANNQARVSNDTVSDPLFLPDELLPDTRSEVAVPIAVGDTVLGVLDVQSNKLNAFAPEDITILQTITNLVATAIRNIRLLEATQINLEEASLLYNAGNQIGKAARPEEVYQVASRAMRQSSFLTTLLVTDGMKMRVLQTETEDKIFQAQILDFSSMELEILIPGSDRYLIADIDEIPSLPTPLQELLDEWMVESVAFIPVRAVNRIDALIILATRETGSFTTTSIQPYTNLAEMISTSIDKLEAQKSYQSQLSELQTISEVGRSVAAQTDFHNLLETVHQGIRQSIGDVNFLMAMYDAETQMITVPYMTDGETITEVSAFPLGQGLSSIVIRTREPLLLKSVDEAELSRLGAKIIGQSARSWLGVPLIFGSEVIGVMAVQDLVHTNRFNEDHVRLLMTLATQITVAIRNARLLEQARVTADRERTLNELSSKIRSSVEMRKILETTAIELGKVMGARRTRVQLDFGASPSGNGDGQKAEVK